jgi:hypothetical protein
MSSSQRDCQPRLYSDCGTHDEVFEKLEAYATNKIKVPLDKKQTAAKNEKIGRQNADGLLKQSSELPRIGNLNYKDSQMTDVLKHNFLK